jgi:hypothetical protein
VQTCWLAPETGGFRPLNHQTDTNADSMRILELEMQNARLQRLVAELLIKNQRLRLKQRLLELARRPDSLLKHFS